MTVEAEPSPLLCDADAVVGERQDLLRRFTPTEHKADLKLMGRTVRLETNRGEMLALARKFFERHQYGKAGEPEFLWRLVCETDSQVSSTTVPLAAFSDSGLRYVNVGQGGFLAVDLVRREAAGYLVDDFLQAGSRVKPHRPLDILFCMTAASVGLTALAGGCVGVGDRAVMIFGPPNSGKTTASYLAAARLGMEFHADQVVFLDTRSNTVRAWGDFFPAVFRPETLEFLPELKGSAQLSACADLSFYYFDKRPLQRSRAHSVAPMCSIFLERLSSHETRLAEISRDEARSRLQTFLLFKEDRQFDAQTAAALSALAERPAYSLQYGDDPALAAAVIEKLLP